MADVIKFSSTKAEVEMSHDELLILRNSLNEVLDAKDRSEFEAKLGFSWLTVAKLHDELNDIQKHMVISEAASRTKKK
jgi:hypothetical protein